MLPFYHLEPSIVGLTPNPATGLLPPPSTSTHTNAGQLAPVTMDNFQDPSPGFDTQLHFEAMMCNLQELVSLDHYTNNSPSEDFWLKQHGSMLHDTSFNHSVYPNTFPTSGVSYTNSQVVPSVSIRPYPTGLSMPVAQYPTNWIIPNTSTTEPTSYPTNLSVPITEQGLLTNQTVPNKSAKEPSPNTNNQIVSNILAEDISGNPSHKIVPNSSPGGLKVSQSMDQEKVAARGSNIWPDTRI